MLISQLPAGLICKAWGKKLAVRPLDLTAGRLNVVLDVLVRAGHILTASSEIPESLNNIAQLCTSTFADRCSIRVQFDALGSDEFAADVGTHAEQPLDERHRIIEPLLAGRRYFGEICCETRASDGFDEAIRQAARLLALQLAAVISAQAAALRERRIADRFQRALLPDTLPSVPGAGFHAAYRPASDEADVGGDWYDAFPLADGRIAISVGDVAGHGVDAAVIMGEVRQAIRTAAIGGNETPAAVLEYVNGVMHLRESSMVTAIFAVYDSATSILSYASAGHPPPILVLPQSGARQLPTAGLPLGCTQRIDSVTWTFTVPQDARAVFYTDGLVENERDLIAGEHRLLEAINAVDGADNPAAAVQERVFGTNGNRDDAAVLMLTRHAPVSRYVFSALPIVAPLARAIVSRALQPLGLSHDRRFGILVAVGEAVANAIEHAYRGVPIGVISLRLERSTGQLVITVEDFGRWRPFVPHEARGRGIELMHAFMDGVQIRSSRDSTIITLRAELDAKEA